MERIAQELVFNWDNGETVANEAPNVGFGGRFATVIVPAGSDLIGKDLQLVAHSPDSKYADTNLLSTAKTLVAGSNPLSEAELLEVGSAKHLKLSVNLAVSGTPSCVLLWKS